MTDGASSSGNGNVNDNDESGNTTAESNANANNGTGGNRDGRANNGGGSVSLDQLRTGSINSNTPPGPSLTPSFTMQTRSMSTRSVPAPAPGGPPSSSSSSSHQQQYHVEENASNGNNGETQQQQVLPEPQSRLQPQPQPPPLLPPPPPLYTTRPAATLGVAPATGAGMGRRPTPILTRPLSSSVVADEHGLPPPPYTTSQLQYHNPPPYTPYPHTHPYPSYPYPYSPYYNPSPNHNHQYQHQQHQQHHHALPPLPPTQPQPHQFRHQQQHHHHHHQQQQPRPLQNRTTGGVDNNNNNKSSSGSKEKGKENGRDVGAGDNAGTGPTQSQKRKRAITPPPTAATTTTGADAADVDDDNNDTRRVPSKRQRPSTVKNAEEEDGDDNDDNDDDDQSNAAGSSLRPSEQKRRRDASPADDDNSVRATAKRPRTLGGNNNKNNNNNDNNNNNHNDGGGGGGYWMTAPEAPLGSAGGGLGGPGKELICLCTKTPKVPRPRNAFILYRQHHQAQVAALHPGLANPEISKLIGEQWREQPDEVKNSWKRLAEEEKILHSYKYPGYRYQPRRGGNKGAAAAANSDSSTARPVSSSAAGGDPDRCFKCGGRYIATPRTPSTPFAAAAAATVATTSGLMTPLTSKSVNGLPPPYSSNPPPPNGINPNFNPRMVEAATAAVDQRHFHPGMPHRHGSTTGILSVDDQGRRYTQPHFREIDEDYVLQMSPAAAAGGLPVKRRRYNDHSNGIAPGSPQPAPPMGYVPADRFSRSSFSSGTGGQPPLSATGIGPAGSLPRMQQYQPLSSGGSAQAHHQPHPYRHIYDQPPHMQPPPPRASVSYHHHHQQQQPLTTPGRLNSGFDESLRLPPLQTQLPNSPPLSANMVNMGNAGQQLTPVMATHHQPVNSSMMNGPPGPPLQPQHHAYQAQQLQQPQQQHSPQMGLRWSFLGKLDILRVISPPLKSPGPGQPPLEARGPLIAVEGAVPFMLKEVTTVIKKALSISGECAVKIWSEDKELTSGAGEGNGVESSSDDKAALEGEIGKGFVSPIASYMTRMLNWHKTSGELVKYLTTHPSKNTPVSGDSSDDLGSTAAGEEVSGEGTAHPDQKLLPVAVVSDGYSLTASDKWANTLPINDAYLADDHWRWLATLWRGIVGADLTVYVKRTTVADEEMRGGGGQNCVEFANAEHSVLVLRMVDDGRGMDEKLERRLGFEIIEWVRTGGFKADVAAKIATPIPAAASAAAVGRQP